VSGALYGGSFGLYKLDAQLGGTQGIANYRVDLSRFHIDGYREHAAATRDQSNAKLKLQLPAGRLTVVVNTLDQPQAQDPLGLTRAQLAANPRQAAAQALAFDTRKSVWQSQGGLTYDVDIGASDTLQVRGYAGDRQVTQYLGIPLAPQLAATSSGGVVDLDRGYGGAGARWMHTLVDGARPMLLTTGLDYDRQSEQRRGYINDFGIAGALKRDERDTVGNTDVYAQLEWRFLEQWSAMAGLRHSRVRFRTEDRYVVPGNGDDSGAISYVKTLPVAGIVYRIAPDWSAYANIGRGFETPTFAELAYRAGNATGLNLALRPAESVHREVGLKARIAPDTRIGVALFHVNTTNEIVVDEASGGRTVYANAPGSRRSGVEASWSSRLPRGFAAYASYTRLTAEFTQAYVSGGETVAAGNRLPGVPRYSWFGELAWRSADGGLHAGIEARGAGSIEVNDANSEATSAYAIASLHAGIEQRSGGWRFTEFVRVNNVTGRRYVGSVIVGDANGRYYEPAPGRNHVVGVSARLRF
jgi:iron complex outermembrane receptor protein